MGPSSSTGRGKQSREQALRPDGFCPGASSGKRNLARGGRATVAVRESRIVEIDEQMFLTGIRKFDFSLSDLFFPMNIKSILRHPARLTFAVLCLGLLPLAAQGSGLTGSSVTGSLMFNGNPTNYFDPANGYVPSGYLNTMGPTVTIQAPAVEFGFDDTTNLDLTNFSASQFTVEDVVENSSGNAPFTMTFTDSAFMGMTFNKVSDSFPNGGLTYAVTGDTITINWAGGPVNTNDDYTSTFTVVPEPSTWATALVGLGLLGCALRFRRTRLA
jgi:hypothetical protein